MEKILAELIKTNKIDSLLYLLDSIPFAILIIKNPDGKIAYVNHRAKELFGIKIQEEASIITGMAKFKALLPNGEICPNEQLPLLRTLLHGETIVNQELNFEFADGHIAILNINAMPLYDEKNEILAAIGALEDITDRKNLNKRLNESLDLYSNLVLASPNAIIMQSDMKIIFVNPEGQKLFGITNENQIIGKSVLSIVSEEFIEIAKQRIRQAETEQTPPREIKFIRLDGSSFYGEATSKRLIYKGKLATQLIIKDIDKIKTFEKRYCDLFNDMTEGLATYDIVYDEKGEISDFRFTDINPAFEHLMGRTRKDVIGKLLSEMIPEEDKHLINTYKKIALNCKSLHFDKYSPTIGKYFDVYAYCIPPKQFGIMFLDITERKKLEEVLKRDKETLEKLVIERSHELIEAHADLEKTKRLSDIGTLAATVAHELRNPLVAINISVGVIKKKSSDPVIKKPLENIEKSLAESEQIINNLLLYSKMKLPNLEKILLYDIFEECIESSLGQFKKKLIKNKLDILKDIHINVDPHQIKEVFHNILNNACEALENKKGQIDIWAREDKEFVKIFVRDNGVGIPKEHLDDVFSPFFTTKTRGTGLGLAVCYQIIHAHGGSIDIESVPHKGTTVSISLPKK